MTNRNTTLSYLIATKNKLPYLKVSLETLMNNKQSDEEIIVIDGNSTDGTKEYLEKLFRDNKIDLYLSEPDKGEGHANNKGFLLAKGELLKIVTDDDACHYPSIQKCKEFMLSNVDVDIISTDGIKRRNNISYPFSPMLYQSRFEKWTKNHTPFASCGLGLMIRKKSLPVVGLFNISFVRMDAEYTLRMTAGKGKIAWYTHESYAHIRNINSNSNTQEQKITEELERLEAFYFPEKFYLPLKQKIKFLIKSLIGKFKSAPKNKEVTDPNILHDEWVDMYKTSISWLEENSRHNNGQFLY